MTIHDPDGLRLPIKVDTTTNGEFAPRPLPKAAREANKLAFEEGDKAAKALGITRRTFFTSVAGAAATLIAFNKVHAAAGATGGSYQLPREAGFEVAAADGVLKSNQFIFDIQNHHVAPLATWRNQNSPMRKYFEQIPLGSNRKTDIDIFEELGRKAYVKEVFFDSDTDMAVLTFVPTTEDDMPLSTEEAATTRSIVNALYGTDRLLIHGRVIPSLPGDLARMDELAKRWKIGAWKTYTQFGPGGTGWWLDDEKTGGALFENARRLGNHLVCIHKGLPLAVMGDKNLEYGRADDVGRAAKKFPDMNLVIFHSAFDPTVVETEFKPGSGKAGIDSLIQSVVDNGIGRDGNVYAELGSTWRYLMRDPNQAAHCLGKLIKYLGEDRVLWGTDSIWYGSPQDQIQAFRAFQISDEFCSKYGYEKLSPSVKDKILGLSSAQLYNIDVPKFMKASTDDTISHQRRAYLENADPAFLTYGPRTRAEFLRMLSCGSELA